VFSFLQNGKYAVSSGGDIGVEWNDDVSHPAN
jgi:hypothetical protein